MPGCPIAGHDIGLYYLILLGYCLLVLRSRGARGARGARRARGAREARGARGAREARQARGARGARAGSMNPFCFLHCIWSSSTNSSV